MSLRRSVKNFVNKFSLPVVKVREATSNDPWGPSSSLMLEIADLTFNANALTEIMGVLWQRLNDRGKNWRHVYKSLTVVEYLLNNGSEKVIQHCREGLFNFRNLEEFRYVDDSGREQGSRICEKARHVIKILSDEELLIKMRRDARRTRIRMSPSSRFSHSSNHTYPGDQETDDNQTDSGSSATDVLQQSEQTSSPENSPSKTDCDWSVPEETSPQANNTDVMQNLIILSEGDSTDADDQSNFRASKHPFPETCTRLSPGEVPHNKGPSVMNGSRCTAPRLASHLNEGAQNAFQTTGLSLLGIPTSPKMHQIQQPYTSPAFSMPYTMTSSTAGISSTSSRIMSSQYEQTQIFASAPPTHCSHNPFL